MLEFRSLSAAPSCPNRGRLVVFVLAGFIAALFADMHLAAREPIALHPDNQHYFLFRGQPTVLISSAEHYGAVLNLDFDFSKYLAELEAHRLNHTRTFTGVYCGHPVTSRITKSPLVPPAGRLICPWARSDTPGYANGGNKFDLTKWDEAYFTRLRDFVAEAGRRNIVVEITLFCVFYDDAKWQFSPMNAANNINGVGDVDRQDVYVPARNGQLMAVQEAVVRKIVAELRDFDNLYFEVCNEPYIRNVPPEWEERIVDVIMHAESEFTGKHLISLNVANKTAKIVDPHPGVSIFNFHYAAPPIAVSDNYGLNRVIGDNERTQKPRWGIPTGLSKKPGDTYFHAGGHLRRDRRLEAAVFGMGTGVSFPHSGHATKCRSR